MAYLIAAELIKELNKRKNLPDKILVRDIKMLWESGHISGNKEARNCFGRTKYKFKDTKFDLQKTESEIIYFIKKRENKCQK